MGRIIHAADLFCGAGGTSTGLYRACDHLDAEINLIAINHWTVAVETHKANHPDARHICANIEAIDPREAVPSGRLDIMVASPECTHHSIARGGRPVCDQMRASAWHVLRWVELLRIDNILIENVQEFRNWGPLGTNGRPLKSRQGETYKAFLSALRSMNYTVDDRVLNAADYGDPTSRRRLFIMAKRGNHKITWPDPTHGETDMFKNRKPYRTAREIIDWSIKGQSIFERKRPLAPNTMRRIMAGLRKFGGESFIVHLRGTQDSQLKGSAKSIDKPVPTLTGSGAHVGLCETLPKIACNCGAVFYGTLDKPCPECGQFASGYVTYPPFLIHTNHAGGDRVHDLSNPLPTVTCGHRGEMALIEPFVIGQQSKSSPRSVDSPLPTIATKGAIALVEPFIIPRFGSAGPRSVEKPLGTITTTSRGVGLVQPFLIRYQGSHKGKADGDTRSHSMDRPLPTLDTSNRYALVDPFIVQYNGQSESHSIDKPLNTVTTKERYGLVEVSGKYQIDIRFRMLQPHELAAAMSFENYKFAGNRGDQVKQIGNAVPVCTAAALCGELLRTA